MLTSLPVEKCSNMESRTLFRVVKSSRQPEKIAAYTWLVSKMMEHVQYSIEPPKHHYLNIGHILQSKVVLPCVYLFPLTNGYFAYF